MLAVLLLSTMAVLPAETDALLRNPLAGWALIDHAVPGQIDAGASVDLCEDGTTFAWYPNTAVLSTWAQVELEPGKFNWSLMDQALDYWAGAGKTLHLRFSTEDFGNIPGMPRWLRDMGVPVQERGHQLFPDYTHPVYLDRLERFLAVFGEKFFGDPRIETVDLRAYGNWGEWHSGYHYADVETRVTALRGLIDAWRQANAGRKYLMLSASYEWETWHNAGKPTLPLGTAVYGRYRPSYRDFLHRGAFDYACVFPDVALRRDGCGGAVKQPYDGRLMANFFAHWRKPIFTEFFGPASAFRQPSPTGYPNTREGDDFVPNAVDEIISYHPNYSSPLGWLGEKAADFYNNDREQMLKGHAWMGHRFVLVEADYPAAVRPGGVFALRQVWENRAMGRCYRRFPLAVYLMRGDDIVWRGVDESFDQRAFVAGEQYHVVSEFTLPDELAEGAYALRIAMLDGTGAPALRLAIQGEDNALRYRLGKLEVSAEAKPAPPLPAHTVKHEGGRWVLDETLEPNTQYLVSFEYVILRGPEHDLHTERPGYFRCYAQSAEHRRVGETRWFDKAGQPPARKTVLIPTEGGSYRLYWEAVGGGAMEIRRVRIEKLPGENVHWVGLHTEDVHVSGGAERYQQFRVRARRDCAEVTLPHDWQPFLRTHPGRIPLDSDSVYTVWFDFAAEPRISQGDYFYLRLRGTGAPPDPGAAGMRPGRGFFRWTQRHTANPVRRCYSFRTGAEGGQILEWGMKNGGGCEVSNVFVQRHSEENR